MPDIWYDVDVALSEVPVNVFPLTDDTDFKTIEADVNYNAAGLVLIWHFVTTAGAYSQTAVTPTNTGGNYDWVEQGNGLFTIEIPASGGATINNATEGFGWFTGVATGVLPWRGPTCGFRAAALNDSLVDGAGFATDDDVADAILARDLGSGSGAGTLNERTVRAALRFLRNKWGIAAGTLTVTKEDDTAAAWTGAVTTNSSVDPVTQIDPT